MLLRAWKLFAEEGGKVHGVYCVRRGDVGSDQEGGRQRIRWRSASNGKRGPGEKRGGSREDKGNRGDGEGAGRKRSDRVLWGDGSGGEERPADRTQEWGKVDGMHERASNVFLKERIGESGEEMGDGSTTVGDPERRKVSVAGIYGVRDV